MLDKAFIELTAMLTDLGGDPAEENAYDAETGEAE